MALRELFAMFTAKVDIGDVEKADKALDQAKHHAESLGEAFEHLKHVAEGALAALGIEKAIEGAEHLAQEADAVGDLSAALGVNTGTLQVWQEVLVRSGGSAEGAGTLFRVLAGNIAEAAAGGKDAVANFKALGVEIHKNADGTLPSLDDVLGRVGGGLADLTDGTQRAAVASKLLGRGALSILPAFGQGREELDKMLATLGTTSVVFDEEFIKSADESEKVTRTLDASMKRLGVSLARLVLPIIDKFKEAVTPIADILTRWFRNGDNVRALLITIATVAIPYLITAFGGLGAILTSLRTLAIETFLPFLIIAAIGLAVEDLIVFLMGGDSALGAFLDTAFGVGTAKEVLDTLIGAWQFLSDVVLPAARDAFNDFVAWFVQGIQTDVAWAVWLYNQWLAVFGAFGGPVKEMLADITGAFGNFFSWVADKMAALIPDSVRKLAGGLFDSLDSKADNAARDRSRGAALGGSIDTYGNFTGATRVAGGEAAPSAGGGGAPGSSKTVVDQRTLHVNVHGATASNPGAVGREVGAHVSNAQAQDRQAILEAVQ